jgi:predicted ABC-class ATPase
MPSQSDLRQQLLRLDGANYKAYKEIKGRYQFPDFTLWIDRVQGDPFASPSHVRVQVPQAITEFPPHLYRSFSREVALRDYLTRQFDQVARSVRQHRGIGSSGLIAISSPSQTVLERTSAWIDDETVEVRFVVGLPAFGRRIAGQHAADLLCSDLPQLVDQALKFAQLDGPAIEQHVATVEDADWLRQALEAQNLVAFIANGSLLPRLSGVADQPLQQAAIPFQAPESLTVEFTCPNRGIITGMGIPAGVTLIVGGGYHGKSTLLRAIEQGIYNHIPGDGREFVVTQPTAVKIRAEDGRSIHNVDISPFINHLPQGRSTTQFSTPNASGSTSQAANILEALEAGSTLLLLDEDTCATNFMIRDRRMQALIAKTQEPITPFIDKIRQLYTEQGVSTILVMGGSGDYFEVADTVIAMTDFMPQAVTQQAKAIAMQYPSDRLPEGGQQFGAIAPRLFSPDLLQFGDDPKPPKSKVFDVDTLVLGRQQINLTAVEQLVETGQLRAIAAAILYLADHYGDRPQPLSTLLNTLMADIEAAGLDCLTVHPQGDLARFRRFELAAALNRLRT